MRVIYEPKGKAREYSPLAANLYDGCAHGCLYCYAPRVLKKTREAFAKKYPRPRAGVLEQLEKDAQRFAARGKKGPVLLSFTSDPYQSCEGVHRVTRKAIQILADAGLGVRVLTKNPALAIGFDMDILRKAQVDFGVSLSWTRERDRIKWEPEASPLDERVLSLYVAKWAGLRTWVSIEPVIDPGQAVALLDLDMVDVFKIGKLNHDKEREREIDWGQFLDDVLARLEGRDCGYYIKHDLWAFADDEIKARYQRERTVAESGGA